VKQIVSRPKHPETLGKIERFWGTLWRECLAEASFRDLDEARRRLQMFVDYYNFQRTLGLSSAQLSQSRGEKSPSRGKPKRKRKPGQHGVGPLFAI